MVVIMQSKATAIRTRILDIARIYTREDGSLCLSRKLEVKMPDIIIEPSILLSQQNIEVFNDAEQRITGQHY